MRTHISVRRVTGRRIPDEERRAARADAVIDGARPAGDDDWAVAALTFALREAYLTPGTRPPRRDGGRPG